jgi:hypothetical protein
MSSNPDDLVGRRVRDSDDQPVGTVTAVYRYPDDLAAPWGVAAVSRGRLFRTVRLVDLEEAAVDADLVRVPHSRRTIGRAPAYTPLFGDTLSALNSADVRDHYRGSALPA